MKKKLLIGISMILIGLAIVILGTLILDGVPNTEIFTPKEEFIFFCSYILLATGTILVVSGLVVIGTLLF